FLPNGNSQRIEGQAFEVLGNTLFIENTDNGILTKDAWHDRDTKIDRFSPETHLETTILWNASFRNIKFTHDLDTRDNRTLKTSIERLGGTEEYPIDAIFNNNAVKT